MGDGKGSGYNSTIPDAPGVDSHPLTKELAEKIGDLVDQDVKAMDLSLEIETVQIKEWIRTRDENLRRGK